MGFKMPTSQDRFKFKISTSLKNVLGSQLITDDEVAVFELVKNSFDAGATRVDLYFSENSFVISDNGEGMSLDDIQNKWLFVAYSSKRADSRSNDYRSKIKPKRQIAGSKGIGRFSTDRLGARVIIQSKPKLRKKDPIHQLTIDWNKFDSDQEKKFTSVGLIYQPVKKFIVPQQFRRHSYGTVISISELRNDWDREKLIKLKSSLTKLINPLGTGSDNFKIFLHAPQEVAADDEQNEAHKIINGEVENFIFNSLKEKTTYITVRMSSNGSEILSELVDRGECVYRIREPNPYEKLKLIRFNCQLFFLNRTAKSAFTKRVGVQPVRFGSVFLFRNGFRIFPIGNPGDDWLHIDRRHQQGFARFLGSRNIIGKIEITDETNQFEEATSRNAGLIEDASTDQLRKIFTNHCLARLERYVVPVLFPDKENNTTEDISRVLTDPAKARAAKSLASLIKGEQVKLLEYSDRLVGIISERSESFQDSIADLTLIANKTKDNKLLKKIEAANKMFEKIKQAQELAKKVAERERRAKEKAEAAFKASESKLTKKTEELEAEKKKNLFLSSLASMDAETAINLHHQITIYSVDLNQEIENYYVQYRHKKTVAKEEIDKTFDRISLLNKKMGGIAKFATKAEFILDGEKIKDSLSKFISQYITEIASKYTTKNMEVTVHCDNYNDTLSFKPIEVSIIIDNLISNARKARATLINFNISHPDKKRIHIRVTDNGTGIDLPSDDIEWMFEKGNTTTDGSGLGLYHIREILGELNGTIIALPSDKNGGSNFEIRIAA